MATIASWVFWLLVSLIILYYILNFQMHFSVLCFKMLVAECLNLDKRFFGHNSFFGQLSCWQIIDFHLRQTRFVVILDYFIKRIIINLCLNVECIFKNWICWVTCFRIFKSKSVRLNQLFLRFPTLKRFWRLIQRLDFIVCMVKFIHRQWVIGNAIHLTNRYLLWWMNLQLFYFPWADFRNFHFFPLFKNFFFLIEITVEDV